VTTKEWIENDELFFGELETGHKMQRYAGRRLLDAGFVVQVPPSTKRKSRSEIDSYADEADIWVGAWGQAPTKVEVKSRKYDFQGVADYPYDPIFLTTVQSWEAATTKPAVFLIVSQVSGAIIATSSVHRAEWMQTRTFDTKRQIRVTNHAALKNRFVSFEAFCIALATKFGGSE
jgi:hypothetical protein